MSRPAGFFERYYIHRDTTGVMNRGFNVSVSYPRHVSDALLSNALQQMLPTHYYFHSNAFREESENTGLLQDALAEDARQNGKNYRIRAVDRILYSELVHKSSVDVFDDAEFEALSHVRVPVNVEKPTYYLKLLEEKSTGNQYVVFASNHMLFDGTSAVHFLQDLAHYMSQVPANCEPVEVLFEAEKSVISVEPSGDVKSGLYSSSTWFKVWTILKLQIPAFVVKLYNSYLNSKSPNFFQHPLFNVASFKAGSDSRFKMVRYSPAHTAQLLHKCRQNKTTLTALLASQLSYCVQKSFLPHLGPFSSSVSIAVNGRRFYPDLDLRYGLYIASVTQHFGPGKTVFGGASDIQGALADCFKTRLPFRFVGLWDYVNVWHYMQVKIASGSRDTIEVSNLGVVDIPEPGWAPEQVFFSQSVTDSHFVCSCVSTKNGGLNMMIAYHKSLDTYEWQGQKTVEKCIGDFSRELCAV